MRHYDELTGRGKRRRLMQLATEVLKAYTMPVKKLSFFRQDTNLLYKIETTTLELYVLRIYSDEESTFQDTLTEVFWLNALRRDLNFNVVEPVARKDGEFISLASLPCGPVNQRCVAFRWVPGCSLETRIKPDFYFQLGAMMAQLHSHARSLSIPDHIHPNRWDRVFYFPDEQAIYHLPEYQKFITAKQHVMLNEVIEQCNLLLDGLYHQGIPPFLIHGDLHHGNVHIYRGQLTLLDFESVLIGFPEQDIAITLYYVQDRPDCSTLTTAFRNGYTSICPWPIESNAQLAGLMAARNANFINYVIAHTPNPLPMLEGMFARLSRFHQMMKS